MFCPIWTACGWFAVKYACKFWTGGACVEFGTAAAPCGEPPALVFVEVAPAPAPLEVTGS
jgi:hypothetical protein